MDFFIEKMIMPGIFLVIALLLIAVPFALYAAYQEDKSPEIKLKKNQWTCTHTY